ncbi:glutamine amidotransferase [Dyella lutea]|uniref:Glutamine amidotransferase n=1 Tax=Dyella lutea TaxID=2950441 RepID=A0ABT1F6A0_9GAMM|nr:glutamine amidotransferase [Dyella lutea]MCP1372916.1 glutamine amidotransferase [Dyella lutea]
MKAPVLVIRTGSAPAPIRARHGDFPQWFRVATGLARERVREIDVVSGEALPAPGEVAGAFITGSASMVTDRAAWSERTAGWIRSAMDRGLPLFGVCYGHQLLAHALGGRVGYLPGGREIGTLPIERLAEAVDDPVAGAMPGRFHAHTTHEQSVLELPAGVRVLARSARDPHHLLRYGPNALSVQFHPEFNAEIMRAYIHRKRHDMRREGSDAQRVYASVNPTPYARRLLRSFVRHHALDR